MHEQAPQRDHDHGLGDRVDDAVDSAQDAVVDLADHPLVEAGARAGYVANALMHLGIAAIALRLALGYRGEHADQSGAMSLIDDHGWGMALLVGGAVGWGLLALWQLGEAALPWATKGERAKALAKVLVYVALAWTCVKFLQHAGASSGAQSADVVRDVLEQPGGRTLVVLGGLVVVGVGAYHVVKGVRRRFLRDLREDPGDLAVGAGVVGYTAKGIALVVAGLLVVQAAVQTDPAKASGLDGAFRALLGAPFGAALVAFVGLGFAAYAGYSLARAWYARV